MNFGVSFEAWHLESQDLHPDVLNNTSVAFEPIFMAGQTSQYDVIKSARNTEIQDVDPLAESKIMVLQTLLSIHK